jgi:hypothetical protein
VQTVLIQDLSLHNAQSRITDLETQLTETKRASSTLQAFLAVRASSAQCSAAVNLWAVFGQANRRRVAPGAEQSPAARSAPGAGLMDGGGSTEEHAGAGYDANLPGSDPAADPGQDLNGNNAS